MFRWLKTWLFERRARRERLLFRVFDGRRIKSLDPWQIWRDLRDDPNFDIETGMDLVRVAQEPETTHCLNAIARAFYVSRFDPHSGTGLTDAELFAVLDEYLEFCEVLQKKTNGGPISSPPMAPAFSNGQDPLRAATN